MSDVVELPRGVRYGSDADPGIRRTGTKRVRYVDDATGMSPPPDEIDRIRRLAIPPAWTNVWIAADARSHVQATGRDSRGRKQYRYHPDFVVHRSTDKFGGLLTFGSSLGSLRRQVNQDLAADSVTHDHVVAVVVRLLDLTALRIGNEAYARENSSFGLTTLRNRHALVQGSSVKFKFRGKGAHLFDITITDKHLAKLVRRCQILPGQYLFEYLDHDGNVRHIGSTDVNEYVSRHGANGASAKTFRTWEASTLAAHGLASISDGRVTKSALNGVIEEVAAHLGNTPTVCRASYVHPLVIDSYLDGSLADRWTPPAPRAPGGLNTEERRLLRLLSN